MDDRPLSGLFTPHTPWDVPDGVGPYTTHKDWMNFHIPNPYCPSYPSNDRDPSNGYQRRRGYDQMI